MSQQYQLKRILDTGSELVRAQVIKSCSYSPIAYKYSTFHPLDRVPIRSVTWTFLDGHTHEFTPADRLEPADIAWVLSENIHRGHDFCQ